MENNLLAVGLYVKNGEFKKIVRPYKCHRPSEVVDMDSALRALRESGDKDFFAIYAQRDDGRYVGIGTEETSRNRAEFRRHKKEWDLYTPNYSKGYTNEMVVAAIMGAEE